jgi:hypothetical protein
MIKPFARFGRRAVRGLELSVRDPATGWLMLRMLAWRAALPVLERVVPLPTLVRLMGRHSRARDRNGQPQRIAALAERVFAAPRTPRNCLARSMVTYRYLSTTSLAPQLVIAFRKGGAPVLGHAWVTVDEVPLHDSPEALAEFEPLVTFGPRDVVSGRT